MKFVIEAEQSLVHDCRQYIVRYQLILNFESRSIAVIASVENHREIKLRYQHRNLTAVAASLEDVRIARPEWVEFDEGKTTATVKGLPKVDSVPFALEIDLVIEYYSKRL